MRVLLLLLVVGAMLLAPFVALKQPWAVRMWRRVKKLFFVYVLAISISAVVWLILRWEDFYG